MSEPAATTRGPDELLALMPFATALGIQLHKATLALVTGSLAWTPERCTAGGILHGGAIMSLADTIGGLCAFLNLPEGASTATIDSTTRLYRATVIADDFMSHIVRSSDRPKGQVGLARGRGVRR